MSFGRRGKYFEEFLNPRAANGIGDFLELNLIPNLKGIYREDLLKHHGLKPKKPEAQAVLLSHAHADHANYISFLHEDIPIYCGKTCKYILEAVKEQAKREIENEVIDYKKRPVFKSNYRDPPIIRDFITFRTGDKIKIDNLEIEPCHVDHSVPGAYGFIIHTSEGTIIYTGDLRAHGIHKEMTEDFIINSTMEKPIALITEGTRVDSGKTLESEDKVYDKCKKNLIENNRLSIVDFNFKDVDRFTTFYKIAKEIGKKLVISFKHACYLERYHRDKKLKTPDSKDENIFILKPKRFSGTYIDEDYIDYYIKKRLSYPNIITAEDIRKKPKNCIVIINFWYLNMLVDLKPKKGMYIHSLSEPFNEEMKISYERMVNWIMHYDMNFIQSHCSGHINGPDLMDMIKKINPKNVYPIHTEKPQLFNKLKTNTVMVKEAKEYKL